MGDDLGRKPSLEKTQALLMLGFHEWTELQGQMGFIKIRTAISCAQALRYQDNTLLEQATYAKIRDCKDDNAKSDMLIDREIERRTFWSCFILDRYVSCGSARPQMLYIASTKKVQLPCSESAFQYGRKIQTRLLGETDEMYSQRRSKLNGASKQLWDSEAESIEWEFGKDEGELSLYIQAVGLFGEVTEWACAGGRR